MTWALAPLFLAYMLSSATCGATTWSLATHKEKIITPKVFIIDMVSMCTVITRAIPNTPLPVRR